ncbi:MAG: acetyl-CoA C-acetyltransferase [Dehalococcoidia bacterium]|nr:acetyl-CoA C-acetyltransferase [Dehalococcoidia bacterium]
MTEVVIVSGVRTAIGTFGGGLKEATATRLGSIVIKDVLKRVGLRPKSGAKLMEFGPKALADTGISELEKRYYDWPDDLKEIQVDEVIMGNVLQAAQGQNPGRQSMIYAGLPKETPAFTVNKICGSGLKAIVCGVQAITLGDADVVIAGGTESMSNAPYAMTRARWGYRMDLTGKGEVLDLMVYDGLWELYYGYHMGVTAENIAAKYGITREEQDKLGLMSHQRALAAIKDGTFKQEIAPVVTPQKKGDPVVFDTDERPMETSLEKMAKLAPAFKKDGTVTAGNASGINDGAAAVLMMSAKKAQEMGLKPMAKVKSYASGGVDPAYMGLGVVPAVKKALAGANLAVKDLDVVELNEAFASQALGCVKELGFDLEKTNVHGSGISLGHPIGATGGRVLVTLVHEMQRRDLKRGLATMCIGGGMGIAMVVER